MVAGNGYLRYDGLGEVGVLDEVGGLTVGVGGVGDVGGLGKVNYIKCLKSLWNEKSGGETKIYKRGSSLKKGGCYPLYDYETLQSNVLFLNMDVKFSEKFLKAMGCSRDFFSTNLVHSNFSFNKIVKL